MQCKQIDNKLNFKTMSKSPKEEFITQAKCFRSLTYKTLGINIKTKNYKQNIQNHLQTLSRMRTPHLNQLQEQY